MVVLGGVVCENGVLVIEEDSSSLQLQVPIPVPVLMTTSFYLNVVRIFQKLF